MLASAFKQDNDSRCPGHCEERGWHSALKMQWPSKITHDKALTIQILPVFKMHKGVEICFVPSWELHESRKDF